MGMKIESKGEQNNSNIYTNEISTSEQNIDEVNINEIDQYKNNNKMEENDSKEKDISEKDIKKAVEKLNSFIYDEGTHAEYSIHKEMHRIMIKIIDNETDKVILEVPPKKIVDMVAKMCELAGVLLDKKA